MNYEIPTLIEVREYEAVVLLDLDEVAAGCKICATGGSGTVDSSRGLSRPTETGRWERPSNGLSR